jgi:hypothetical protein
LDIYTRERIKTKLSGEGKFARIWREGNVKNNIE